MQVGDRVEVCGSDTVIPLFRQGTVSEVNTKRSRFGYFYEVEWDEDIPRRTWVTERSVKLIAQKAA